MNSFQLYEIHIDGRWLDHKGLIILNLANKTTSQNSAYENIKILSTRSYQPDWFDCCGYMEVAG